uniref:Sigma-54 dependent transcriptional regulator n=1 Tax=Roseihalotalea indica TaxID=2867963 RepID=A0AA49JGP2_9BACT|nr:sigma-54 dependent transcriptional regulator [Tunicatimonas sp. TK19036]
MLDQSELRSIKQRFGIIGNSSRLNYALTVAAQVAPTDMTVLITGESGSGKESFSKIIHHLSARKHGQFIAINCGAIPEGTIDSELFGHEKGAFTGAQDARKGYFEVTNGGTIFLDEIGEMPLGTQSRLLRVLENGEFIRVGSSKVQKTDVRVVAATNVNLLEAVQKGKFREDLYYRLNSVPIYVPPLRERGDDIALLFRKFATDFAEQNRTKPIQVTPDGKRALLDYRFPGNIRELKNLVERMSLLVEQRDIDADTLRSFLPPTQQSLPALYRQDKEQGSISERDLLYKVLFEMRHDLNELKKLVLRMLQDENFDSHVIQEHQDLFNGVHSDLRDSRRYEPRGYDPQSASSRQYPREREYEESIAPSLLINGKSKNHEEEAVVDYSNIEDISHETEESDDLSLENKEKELIVKALKRHGQKRKYAAQDLGISERTLYRKIKQYEIEE